MRRAQLADDEWRLIEPFPPVGRFGPRPEWLREQFEGAMETAPSAAVGDQFIEELVSPKPRVCSPGCRGAADPVARVQSDSAADAARQLLGTRSHAAGLIYQAVRDTAAAALEAGVALEDLARWARLPVDALGEALVAYRSSAAIATSPLQQRPSASGASAHHDRARLSPGRARQPSCP